MLVIKIMYIFFQKALITTVLCLSLDLQSYLFTSPLKTMISTNIFRTYRNVPSIIKVIVGRTKAPTYF